MADERKPVRLDLGGFKPKVAPKVDPAQDRAAVAEGKRLGFTGRGEAEKLDGRTLRRKNKTQMNMRVSPAVRRDFLVLAAEFPDADACLAHLIELHRKASP